MFGKKPAEKALLEKYEKFLVNNFKPGVAPAHLDLNAEGWKLFVGENLTPMIEDKLQMKQIGDYIWADDYKDGKRRVLSFFKINDAYATFQWGWNFDFVPRTSGNKAVWARTDKTVYLHIFELSSNFYDSADDSAKKNKEKARDKTIVSRYNIDIKNPGKGLAEKVKQHQNVFCHLLPLMTEYYHGTASYEGILKRIDENMKNSYYRFINSDSLISQAFIEKRMGLLEKAEHDFEAIPFSNEGVKEEYFKKFLNCD